MTLRKYRLRYNNIKSDELCAFIKTRTGVAPEPKKHRSVYIKQLHQLDDEATFRFMDLPPEMRNLVYDYLLTHNRKLGLSADPQLLRASKQIHKEAAGLLPLDSAFHIVADIYRRLYWPDILPESGGRFEILELKSGKSRMLNTASFKLECKSLSAIKAARNVNVVMQASGEYPENSSTPWTTLEIFCEMLVNNCQDMVSVNIEFVGSSNQPIWPRAASARPLSILNRLPGSCTLDIQGLDERTRQLYWKGITGE